MNHKLSSFVQDACTFDPADSLLPFTAEGVLVGWMKKSFAEHLNDWPEHFSVRSRGVGMVGHFETAEHRSAMLTEIIETLATQDAIRGWRGELVTVAESFYAEPLFYIERAAARYFGLTMYAAHLNGLTVRNGQPCMWLSRRSDSKHIDPGRLDNLAAGRITRGENPIGAMRRESFEEAGLPSELSALAKSTGAVRCKREVEEGLHHEIIFVHDLILPESFKPENQDGEVSEFICVPIAEVMNMLETPQQFTVDAVLVIVDHLLRTGYLTSERTDYLELIHALRP